MTASITHITPFSLDNNPDLAALQADLAADKVYLPKLTECGSWTMTNYCDYFEAVQGTAEVIGGAQVGMAVVLTDDTWVVLDQDDPQKTISALLS